METPMTHREALAQTSSKTNCDGVLIDPADSFSSDIDWTVHTCSKCLKTVFTVGGYAHWWNQDEGEPSPSRAQKQAEYRALQEAN